MSADGQRTKWWRKSSENFNRLSRAHERYRQTTDRRQTDGRTTTYSEHELEFTFAKNYKNRLRLAKVVVKNTMSRFLWFTVYIETRTPSGAKFRTFDSL